MTFCPITCITQLSRFAPLSAKYTYSAEKEFHTQLFFVFISLPVSPYESTPLSSIFIIIIFLLTLQTCGRDARNSLSSVVADIAGNPGSPSKAKKPLPRGILVTDVHPSKATAQPRRVYIYIFLFFIFHFLLFIL